MAAAVAESDFESWISAKLQSLNVDDEVFGSYIMSLLGEEDTSRDDKMEAIAGILEEVEDEPVDVICSTILDQWDRARPAGEDVEVTVEASASSEAKMTSIMEKHAAAVVKKDERSKEQKAEKAALLAKYGHVSEEEDDEDDYDEEPSSGKTPDFGLVKNTNADSVLKMQKEQRDKSKQEFEKKREQDKEQRAKDKQKTVDRKEKEKKRTQKQERRR